MHPILWHFQGISLYTYGFTMMAALMILYFLAVRRLDTTFLSRDHLDDLGLIILISIWVGGGLIYFLLFKSHEPDSLKNLFQYKNLQQVGTLSISSSVMLLMSLYCWRKKLPFFKVLDFLIPLFVLGYTLQRLFGCFSAGCCYGIPTDLFWGVRFPETFGIGPTPGVLVHPTQIYLGLTAWLTYGVLRHLQKQQHNKYPTGTLTCVGVAGLFGFYFLIAFVRADVLGTPHVWGIQINQLFAAVLSLAGMIGLFWIHKHQTRVDNKQ